MFKYLERYIGSLSTEILISISVYFIAYILSFYFLGFIESPKKYRFWIRVLGAIGVCSASFTIYICFLFPVPDSRDFILSVLTALLLWLTWLGALWAARESFDQKQIANKNIFEYRKQLKIEQEPYVIIQDKIYFGRANHPESLQPNDYLLLRIKNIGRGPAIRITVSLSLTDHNLALFENNQPHSYDLGSGDSKIDWKIDRHNLDVFFEQNLNTTIEQLATNIEVYLYIFFKDQLGNEYLVRTKFLKSSDSSGMYLKVMENEKLQ
jgi:hypothetical protein